MAQTSASMMVLAHGAGVNVSDTNGNTPQKLAVDSKRLDVIRLLGHDGAKE